MGDGVSDLAGGDFGCVGRKSEWDSSEGVPDGFGVLLDEIGGLSVGDGGFVEWYAEWGWVKGVSYKSKRH